MNAISVLYKFDRRIGRKGLPEDQEFTRNHIPQKGDRISFRGYQGTFTVTGVHWLEGGSGPDVTVYLQ